jgi:large subunit ribosomal protein L18
MPKLSPLQRRKYRIRNKISGTESRPRHSVFRTSRHIYAQVIDDATGRTVATASTLSGDLKGTMTDDDKIARAKKVGALIAKSCIDKKVQQVVFDRNGFLYHGRIKALAEAAREAGLQF